ncbi:MAG TPA: ABC transporter ATP-binding protein [Arenimonas sp.]|nr:ABC transporter ATP-binding protein [Arenimonas sp.]
MSNHPLKRLLQFAKPYKRDIRLGVSFSIFNKIFDVLPELLIGVAVDVVVNQKDSFVARFGIVEPMDQLWLLVALTVIIWVCESLFEYLHSLKWRNLAQNLQHDLRQSTYQHIQTIPPDFVHHERSGRLMAVLNEDINQIERFLNTGANDLIQVFVSSILIGAIFFSLTASTAVLALVPVPLILIGAFWFQKRLYPRYAKAREAAANVSNRLNNNLHGMSTIQAYTAEEFEAEHLQDASDAYRQCQRDAIRFSAAITPVIRMAILFGFVMTLLYGGYLVLNKQLGVGSYSALVYLTQRLLWPMTRLADMTDLYQRAMASVDRALGLLKIQAVTSGTNAAATPVLGALSFEHIHFAYQEKLILENLSLQIPAGQTIALVGGTGSGKSTLIKLALGFNEPQSGRILFDNQDTRELSKQSLRGQIGYVAQEPFLTDGSIAENIAYGQKPNLVLVEQAAKAAEAHDFIQQLPHAYQSPVGERGALLSGGQRQRIALARALYKNPALLILDEATSAVDNETEAAIQRSLSKLNHSRTCLIVAHRLSTVRHADCIHVLDKGQIIESGTHDDLLKQNAAYAALWKLQTGEL